VSDPKTPKDTPEDQVSDADQTPDTAEMAETGPRTDQIEDAEILDEKPGAESDLIAEDGSARDETAEAAMGEAAEAPTDAKPSDEDSAAPEGDITDKDPQDAEAKPEEDVSTDTAADPEPAPEPQPQQQPQPQVIEKRGGFMGPFLGGVVAAGLGFGIAYYMIDQGMLAAGDPDPFAAEREQIGNLEAQISGLQTEIAAALEGAGEDPRVEAIIGSVESVESTIGQLQSEVGTVQSEISQQSEILENLAAQMEAIANLPEGTGSADTAALAALQATLAQQQAENEEMQARLAEAAAQAEAEMQQVRARADALQSETQAAVDAAANRAAVANISAALENGTPLAGSLDNLTGEVPEALSAVSDTGVETLLDLQRQFPAAARAGLAESLKATVSDDPADRFVSFLRAQVGARSLEPREGDDPDAILSRAQAAVSAGQLEDALAEISTLPEAGQAAMADWVGAAEARVAALDAFDTLAAELNTN